MIVTLFVLIVRIFCIMKCKQYEYTLLIYFKSAGM